MRSLGDSDPRRVGSYRLLARLYADEMGPVLLGAAPDGRLVAVKLVSSRLALGDGVAALRQVAGPHFARVVDAGPAEASPWVAAEFQLGVSMRQLIERGVLLGEGDVLRLAAGLVGALTELHRVELVHRDLTSVNVWLVEGGVRVFDFCVDQVAAEFMAPEQAGGQPVTQASNVFSLGSVLHLAATGRSPFAGATRAETLAHLVRAQPELSASLPPRVRQLLAACLTREPLQRPTLDQLRAVIGPIPPGPHPWPSLVRSMIDEQRAEIARLTGVAAPTVRIVVQPRRRPRPQPTPERWKPDKWAVVSGAAIVLTIVFAIVMFNALTPDEPVRAAPTAPDETVVPTTITTTTTMSTTTTEQPPYGEVTGLADKCMDIAGASTGNGTAVQLHECNGTDAQQWELLPDGTVQGLGKCLDVSGGATNDGATVQIYDCNGTGAQQWDVTPDGSIINAQSGKCLDVPANATADGTQLIIWTCHGEDNQRWTPPA